jgi:hypothetical protein
VITFDHKYKALKFHFISGKSSSSGGGGGGGGSDSSSTSINNKNNSVPSFQSLPLARSL